MATQFATTSDYAGRTTDVAAFKGWAPNNNTKVDQVLVSPGDSGQLIAGIEKLVQRFTIELLTELGSLVYLPTRGSTFMLAARAGFWRTGDDVRSSFAIAITDVAENLQVEESESDPDDERFSYAELISVSLLGADVSMSVSVTSLAGTSFTALLPLNVTTY